MISADFYLSSVLLFKCSISGTIGDETILVVMLPAASGALLALKPWMGGRVSPTFSRGGGRATGRRGGGRVTVATFPRGTRGGYVPRILSSS